MKLTWLGHACFRLTSEDYRIVIDPYEDDYVPGLGALCEEAEGIYCSHEHRDHGAMEAVKLHIAFPSPFRVTTIQTFHDDQGGSLRGMNTIHIFEDGNFRAAHLGDLGCELTEEQLGLLEGLDALMIPIGGFYTIDAVQAKALADRLSPRVVLPMHYRGEGFGFDPIGTLEEYTALCDNMVFYDSNTIELTKELPPQTAILKF